MLIIALAAKKRRGKDTVATDLEQRHGFHKFALADPIRDMILHGIQSCKPNNRPNVDWADLIGEGEWDRETDTPFSYQQFIEVSAHAIQEVARLGHDYRDQYTDDYSLCRSLAEGTMREHAISHRDCTIRRLLQFVGTDLVCNKIDRMTWLDLTWKKIIDSGAERVVITDCRQDHELRWMRQQGVVVVGIERPEADADEALNDTHETEKGLRLIRGVDPIIVNAGNDLRRLYEKVDRCVSYIVNEARESA